MYAAVSRPASSKSSPKVPAIARPARLGGDVRHRVQRHVDADGAVLLPGDLAEAPHELLVADRGEPDRLRPLRQRAGGPARRRVLVECVPRVGRDGHRDAEPRRLGQLLDAVVPFGHPSRVGRRIDVEMVEVELCDEARRGAAAEHRRAIEQLALGPDEDRRVEHQPRLLLERHLSEQVVDPLLDRPPRILVRVELAVPVEVAHAPPVDLVGRRLRHAAWDHTVSATTRRGEPQTGRPSRSGARRTPPGVTATNAPSGIRTRVSGGRRKQASWCGTGLCRTRAVTTEVG